MINAGNPEITDELLSAYIDNAVTEAERTLIEAAVASDSDVAWRLASLQETVRLLHALPSLAAPRSFLLTPEQAQQVPLTLAVSSPQLSTGESDRLWSRALAAWLTFWRAGSPALRNATAASFALLLVLLAGPAMLHSTATTERTQSDQAVQHAAVNDQAERLRSAPPTTSTPHVAETSPHRPDATTSVTSSEPSVVSGEDTTTQSIIDEPTSMAPAAAPSELASRGEEEAPSNELGTPDESIIRALNSLPNAVDASSQPGPAPAMAGEIGAPAVEVAPAAAAPGNPPAMAEASDESVPQAAPAPSRLVAGADAALVMAAPKSRVTITADTVANDLLESLDAPSTEGRTVMPTAAAESPAENLTPPASEDAASNERSMAAATKLSDEPQTEPNEGPAAPGDKTDELAGREAVQQPTESDAHAPLPAESAQPTMARTPIWLLYSQLAAALGTVIFAVFWIRSRKG